MQTSGNSSIDTSLIRDIHCGLEVLFESCVAVKFVDNDDDDSFFDSLCIYAYEHFIFCMNRRLYFIHLPIRPT